MGAKKNYKAFTVKDKQHVTEWLNSIQKDLSENYAEDYIYHAVVTGTGIFQNLTPNQVMKFKGETMWAVNSRRMARLCKCAATWTRKKQFLLCKFMLP